MFLFRACLKADTDVAFCMSDGREFQEEIVDGKKDLEKSCVLQCMFRK
jgi:hypothetical protein